MWTGKSQSYGRKQSGRESNRLERERESWREAERRKASKGKFCKSQRSQVSPSRQRQRGRGRQTWCVPHIHSSLTLHRVVMCR